MNIAQYRLIKKFLFKILRFSLLPFFFQEFIQKKKVTILVAHDIDEFAANKIFKYLIKKYNFIALDTFIEAILLKNNKLIPKKALIFTLDDGHIGNYKIYPIIKKFKIPITIFLCAGVINTNRYYWFKYKNDEINKRSLKKISNKERLEVLEKHGFNETKEFELPQSLNKKQIEEMSETVNFQSHTLFHPILPSCTDIEAKREITLSKILLEENYKLKINAIAYPNGDYSDRDILICKDAGYTCGITLDYGFNTINTDLFRLRRLSVNDANNIDELIVRATGVYDFFRTLNGRRQKFGYHKNSNK